LPLFLSWPSDYNMNETSLALQYNQVKEIAVTARAYAVLAMDELADGLARRFDVVAHSIGTDVAANAVVLRESRGNLTSTSIVPRNIILAAPDISTTEFVRRIRPGIVRIDRHIIVYCSDDWALWASRQTNGSDERLGYCTTEPTLKPPMPGVELVIVRGPISGFSRHAYYLSEAKILDDIRAALTDSAATIPVRNYQREIRLP
jgi:esterase/lipase superfamily enzyme